MCMCVFICYYLLWSFWLYKQWYISDIYIYTHTGYVKTQYNCTLKGNEKWWFSYCLWIVCNLFLCLLFACVVVFTVEESKFRRITDEIKGFGPYDGTRNWRASSEVHCKEATYPGCDGCQEEETTKFLS